MTRRRTKIEMEALDLKIRPLYERGCGCKLIGQVLEENHVTVLKRVRRMGLVRTQAEAEQVRVAEVPVPFLRAPNLTALRWAGVGVAIRWFMERGYMVSLPVEPAKYDLIAESDEGLQRIQVKTTTQKEKSGSWSAGIGRNAYDASATPNAGGKFRTAPYGRNDLDLFFIVTGDRSCYLIPLVAVEGQTSVTLDTKYKTFKVSDCGGMVDAVG